MPLSQSNKYPAYVFRTAGGLYFSTGNEWGKVSALRRGFVSSKPHLLPHHDDLRVEVGFSVNEPRTRVYRPISLDEVRPGMQSLHFRGPTLRDSVHTSDIMGTYAGVSTSTFRAGRPHLLYGLDEAWHINAAGTQGRPMHGYGLDGATQPINIEQLYANLRCPRLLRISQEAALEGSAAFTQYSPGWCQFITTLKKGLTHTGAGLRAVYRDPAGSQLPLVRVDNLDLANQSSLEASLDAIEAFLRTVREHCERCGKQDAGMRLVRTPAGEILHFMQLCGTCAKEASNVSR